MIYRVAFGTDGYACDVEADTPDAALLAVARALTNGRYSLHMPSLALKRAEWATVLTNGQTVTVTHSSDA